MKLTAVLIVAACLQVSASAVSQTVSLRLSNIPLDKTLKEISQQTGYEFFYRMEQMKEAKNVSIDVKNLDLRTALDEIFRDQPFSYAIANKTIILSPRPVLPPALLPDTASPGINITGKVLSENGNPIGGATVTIKGTKKARLTNERGDVLLEGIQGATMLVISSIGYEPQEIRLKNGQTSFIVHLKIKVNELSGVEVNNGMFTRKKENFTGAVTSYTGDELKTIGNKNILESLKTLDPSFIIVENNQLGSNPNALPTIEVRGKTSISTTNLNDQYSSDPNQPLFILDGFESTLQAIYDLDMNRVASITILKDAASTSLYGSKAANGVIVVETKRPVPGELRVSYTADLSLDLPDLSSYNLMNGAEKLQFEKLSGVYIVAPANQWQVDQVYNKRLAAVASGVNTYWLSTPVKWGITDRHSLQLSGGNNELLFNAGASYGKQAGVMKGSDRDNWAGNFDLTYRKGKLNVTDIVSISGTTSNESPYGSFSDFAQANPYYIKQNPDGTIPKYLDSNSVSNTMIANPLYNANLFSINQTRSNAYSNNLQAIYTLSRNFRLQGGLMLSRGNTTTIVFVPPDNTAYNGVDPHQKGNYTNTHTDNSSYSANLMLTYARVINKSQFNANIRSDIQQTSAQSVGFSVVGFPYGTDGNPSFAYGFLPYSIPSASTLVSRNIGFLASVNYVYDQQFLLDAVYRLDGSSVFGSNRLYKPFASGGLGWNINKQSYFRNIRWIDMLKLRGDIGLTGNENLGQFTSVSTYSFLPGVNNFGQGLNLLSLGNPNLEWQKTLQASYGLDFTLLHNRISGYVEYYDKWTDPLVISASGVLPSSTAVSSAYVINAGDMTTKGWDFNLHVSPIYNMKKHIVWTIGITGATDKSIYGKFANKLASLNKQQQDDNGLVRYTDGYSPDDMWAVRSRGIDPATGREIFLKKDGTSTFTYDPDDIIKVGNTRPKIEGVINTTLTYKDFFLGANMRYRVGGYLFNSALYDKVENISQTNLVYNQDKRALYDRWQKPGDISQFKAISITSSTPMSSRFVEEDTHLIGESFNIGWRASNGWIRQLKLQGLSFNFYLNDIFRIESVKSERGIDYPFSRSCSFSINASF